MNSKDGQWIIGTLTLLNRTEMIPHHSMEVDSPFSTTGKNPIVTRPSPGAPATTDKRTGN